MIKTSNYKLVMLSMAAVCAIFTLIIALYSHVRLNEKTDILAELQKMPGNIAFANQAIRTAAMAPTHQERDIELRKRFETRKRVDEIISKLDKVDFSKSEKKVYEKMKAWRQDPYRIAQNQIVYLIENDATDKDLWEPMNQYHEYQMTYTAMVWELIEKITDDMRFMYKLLLWYIVVIIFGGIFTVDAYMTLEERKHKRLNVK